MKERMEEIKRTKRKEKQQCMCDRDVCVLYRTLLSWRRGNATGT